MVFVVAFGNHVDNMLTRWLLENVHRKQCVRQDHDGFFSLLSFVVFKRLVGKHAALCTVAIPPWGCRANNLYGKFFFLVVYLNLFLSVIRCHRAAQDKWISYLSPVRARCTNARILAIHLDARIRAFNLSQLLPHTIFVIRVHLRNAARIVTSICTTRCPR